MTLALPTWMLPEDLTLVPDDTTTQLEIPGSELALLHVPRTEGALPSLELSDRPGLLPVRALSASGRDTLARLAGRSGPSPAVVVTERDSRLLRLAVYHVPFYRRLDESLQIGVDDAAADQLARRERRSLGPSEAANLLAADFVWTGADGRSVVLGSHVEPSGEIRGGIQLHARDATLEIRIRAEDGAYVVNRIAPPAQSTSRLLDTFQLIRGDVGFVDHTYATKVEQLRSRLLAEAGGAVVPTSRYLEVWSQYEEASLRRALRQARRFGTVRYRSAEQRSQDRWELTIESPREAQRLFDLPEGSDRLAIYAGRPAWLDDDPGASALMQISQLDRPVATVMTTGLVDADTVAVEIQGRATVELPVSGALVVSLASQATQTDRRARAQEGLLQQPDLQLLLADQNVELPGATRRRLPHPLPASVKRSFGGRDPNTSQLRAMKLAFENGGLIAIQGPPGTGKTSVVAAIEQLYAGATTPLDRRAAVLVSATQHDAVENVLAKSSVYGLPPIKHGRRSGAAVQVDDRVAAWARARARWVDERLASVDGGALADAVLRAATEARSYLAAARSPQQTATLLRRLTEASGPDGLRLLSLEVRSGMEQVASALEVETRRISSAGRRRDVTLRSAAALLRTNAAGFSDDGPAAAMRARALLDVAEWQCRSDADLLDQAADGQAVALHELGELRDRLLDDAAGSSALARRAVRNEQATVLVRLALKEFDAQLERTASARARALVEYRNSLIGDQPAVEETLTRYLTVVGATTQQSATIDTLFEGDVDFRLVVVDEAARAEPLDLLIPLVRARECKVVVGDHRQLPHLVDQELVGEVGTTRGLSSRELLESSLFERFYQRLARSGRAITLDEQYRMHPVIGEFASRQFYPAAERFLSPRPAEDFAHELTTPGYAGRVVRWLDLPGGDEKRVGRSFCRASEADVVGHDLLQLMDDQPGLSFGVIAMYGAQVDALWEAFSLRGLSEKSGTIWRVPDQYRYCLDEHGQEIIENGQWVHRLRVGTVDAFQGREFDVVFVSLVRSNEMRDPRRRFGFTVTPNRLNVAMSRAKRMLVVAGDWATFNVDNPLTEPLRAFHELCERP